MQKKAYLGDSSKERNLVLESTKVCTTEAKTLFIHANEETNHRCGTICQRKWY
jgi:hypothetical protein